MGVENSSRLKLEERKKGRKGTKGRSGRKVGR